VNHGSDPTLPYVSYKHIQLFNIRPHSRSVSHANRHLPVPSGFQVIIQAYTLQRSRRQMVDLTDQQHQEVGDIMTQPIRVDLTGRVCREVIFLWQRTRLASDQSPQVLDQVEVLLFDSNSGTWESEQRRAAALEGRLLECVMNALLYHG
jgi:hypothetical protein